MVLQHTIDSLRFLCDRAGNGVDAIRLIWAYDPTKETPEQLVASLVDLLHEATDESHYNQTPRDLSRVA